jgi:mevalonate kinase
MGEAAGFATGRGYGKVILLGEHSVVYGRPAIAAGLSIGCTARAEPALDTTDSLAVEPWGVRVEAERPEPDPERELLRRGFAALCERVKPGRSAAEPARSWAVHATMQIPGGAGLGGSAALSVAVLRALDAALERTRAADDELEASLAWERVFHGNPSGVDSAMALGGRLALYLRGDKRPSLSPLQAARTLHLVVGNSGEHGSTKAMVASVAEQHASDRSRAERIFDAIAELVTSAQAALESGDHPRLGELMNANQRWLVELGLSTRTLDRLCETARAAGALGAKLTGGGGGGCMIALASDAESSAAIARTLSDASHAAFAVEVSA